MVYRMNGLSYMNNVTSEKFSGIKVDMYYSSIGILIRIHNLLVLVLNLLTIT